MTLSECCKAELIETGFTFEKMMKVTTKTQCRECGKQFSMRQPKPLTLSFSGPDLVGKIHTA